MLGFFSCVFFVLKTPFFKQKSFVNTLKKYMILGNKMKNWRKISVVDAKPGWAVINCSHTKYSCNRKSKANGQ